MDGGARARRARRAARIAHRAACRPHRAARLGRKTMDTTPLEGKVALVTGAGRNIGRAIALALADAGAKVAVNVRASRDEGGAVVDEIAARGGDALLVAADVTQRADVDAMIGSIAKHFGRLDIVVNNAAIRHEVAFAELRFDDW